LSGGRPCEESDDGVARPACSGHLPAPLRPGRTTGPATTETIRMRQQGRDGPAPNRGLNRRERCFVRQLFDLAGKHLMDFGWRHSPEPATTNAAGSGRTAATATSLFRGGPERTPSISRSATRGRALQRYGVASARAARNFRSRGVRPITPWWLSSRMPGSEGSPSADPTARCTRLRAACVAKSWGLPALQSDRQARTGPPEPPAGRRVFSASGIR